MNELMTNLETELKNHIDTLQYFINIINEIVNTHEGENNYGRNKED